MVTKKAKKKKEEKVEEQPLPDIDGHRVIKINGMPWYERDDCDYWKDYYKVVDLIDHGKYKGDELSVYRWFLSHDLWFLVYFGLKISIANHPFVVKACRDIQDGPPSHTLELYAREHFKTSILSIAEPIQKILLNKEERIGLFSYSQRASKAVFNSIKTVLESSDFLKACFPDVLWQEPQREAPKWSEESGLIVKREGFYKEATVEAHSLLEGMPTGKHFTHRVYDDIETPDMVYSPEMTQRLKDSFDMSQNLGTFDGTHRVLGTPYHHQGLLMYLKDRQTLDGTPIYTLRMKPATDDGTPSGKSVFLPQSRLDELKTKRQEFFSQQLLNPTPQGEEKLDFRRITSVPLESIPSNLYKFMLIDPAGQRKDRIGDAWALVVIGVNPYMDDLGASDIYITDLLAEPMTEDEAIAQVVDMYCRAGRVMTLGVEKVGLSTAEIHIANALRSKGKYLSIESGSLAILRPGGRPKEQRILSHLVWPLNNGKIHIVDTIPTAYKSRLEMEMQRFPFWHDDILDALSYGYDLIKDYRFSKFSFQTHQPDLYERIYGERDLAEGTVRKDGWMSV